MTKEFTVTNMIEVNANTLMSNTYFASVFFYIINNDWCWQFHSVPSSISMNNLTPVI